MSFQEDMEYQLTVNTENYYDSVHRFERQSDSKKFEDALREIDRLNSKYKLLGREMPFKLSMMYQTLSDPYKDTLNNRKVLIVLVQQGINYEASSKTVTIKIPSIVDFIVPNAIGELYDDTNHMHRAYQTQQSFGSIRRDAIIYCKKLIIIGNGKDTLGGLENITRYSIVDPKTFETKAVGEFLGLSKIEFINFDASRMSYFQGDFESENLKNNVNLSDINLKRIQNIRGFEYYKQADNKLDTQKISFDGVTDLTDMYNSCKEDTRELKEIDLSAFSNCIICNMNSTFQYSNAVKIYGQDNINFCKTGVYGHQMFFYSCELNELPEFMFRIKVIDPTMAFYNCGNLKAQSKEISQLQLCGDLQETFRQCRLPRNLEIDLSADDESGTNRFKFVNDPKLGKLRVIETSSLKGMFFDCSAESITIQNALIVFSDTRDILYGRNGCKRNRTGYYATRDFDELSLEGLFCMCRNLKSINFKNIKIVNYYGDRSILIVLNDLLNGQSVEEINFENIDIHECYLDMHDMFNNAIYLKKITMKNVQIGLLNKLDDTADQSKNEDRIIDCVMDNVQILGENADRVDDIIGRSLPGFNKVAQRFNLNLIQRCNSTIVYILGCLDSVTPYKYQDDKSVIRFYEYIKYTFDKLKLNCSIDIREIKQSKLFIAEMTLQTHDGLYKYSRQTAASSQKTEELLKRGKEDRLYMWYCAYKQIYDTHGDISKLKIVLNDIQNISVNLNEY